MFEVFKKELTELLRDKKTLLFVVVFPIVVFPLLFAVVAFISSQAALDAEQKVTILIQADTSSMICSSVQNTCASSWVKLL